MTLPAAHLDPAIAHRQRLRLRVRGQVQGVGFRPFVFRLATALGIVGWVRNDAQGVLIEAEGQPPSVLGFRAALLEQAPSLAVVHEIAADELEPTGADSDFRIVASDGGGECRVQVTPDAAICAACLRELRDPHDRHFGYALVNCTHCGPRYSIAIRVPYDRANTTMASFALCEACRGEYENPADRRFHAQPTACPACGPAVVLTEADASPLNGPAAIDRAADLLRAGAVVAVKGIGGYHLAVRADSQAAVLGLRRMKQRDHKPFAIMCRDLAAAEQRVNTSFEALRLLVSPAAPIVLADRRDESLVAEAVAPLSHRLGVMLPYTPLHHLLFDRMPEVAALVMTSGNLSDDPLISDDDEAAAMLGQLCHAVLSHQRPIHRRLDDSVFIDMGRGACLPVRRARGFVPAPIHLANPDNLQGLAFGADLKNTAAVLRGDSAILSQHHGDLGHPAALQAYAQSLDDLLALFDVQPTFVAADLHPDYHSTRAARRWASARDLPVVDVQHHHAHAASLIAEHALAGPILAIACDGYGYGDDGSAWGGELLLADAAGYRRLVSLAPMLLPGGDAAARDVRRCGLALLQQALGPAFSEHPQAAVLVGDREQREMLCAMLDRRVRCVESSSAGRAFDGVAALLGVSEYNSFEAESAIRLESLAARVPAHRVHVGEELFEITDGSPARISLAPFVRLLLGEIGAGRGPAELAAIFHEVLAQAWCSAALRAAAETGVRTVGLTGGVFANQRLSLLLEDKLTRQGLVVLRHRVVPPGDGGIALGQLAVASTLIRLNRKEVA